MSNDVFVIFVNGEYGGLNADVYTAVPLTIRKFERYPVNNQTGLAESLLPPINTTSELPGIVVTALEPN